METHQTVIVVAVGFVVSILSVSVGGTGLIMVPLMIALGLDPRVAVATNKFAILFLSITGSATFLRCVRLPGRRVVAAHVVPVVAGSAAGAAVVASTPHIALKLIIGITTIVVASILFLKRDAGIEQRSRPIRSSAAAVSLAAALPLSVYGGFFTGGYATLLTYLFVFVLGLSFLQAVAASRFLSIFSAAAASLVLGTHGLIDFSLGVPLAAAFAIGGRLGARIAVKKGSRWLNIVFTIAAMVLALRLLAVEIYPLISK
jgi:uncharacterized membrane protein YfcA